MNPKRLPFVFAIHCHQPVGNYEHVFEDCFQKCYRPLSETLAAHPKVRVAFHYSGPLLQFIERKHPQNLELLHRMTARGQLEWIGGGFYEPVLPAIPRRDAVAQIARMRDWVKEFFDYDVKGLWLTERVWEPGLPSILRDAGVEFTLMDDTHFLSAGIHPKDMSGYYRTEDNGAAIDVFPIDWTLRKFIPFHSLDETFGYFWNRKEHQPEYAITLGDDGEKFGVWPGTHKHVFEEKYLERLFDRFDNSADWLEMAHFSEVRARQPARGLVYMPTASYPEMMEWALPYEARLVYEGVASEVKHRHDHERFDRFLRGAHWRNFFAKYPESNFMHKKMLHLSDRLERARESAGPHRAAWEKAYDLLLQGQCNCAYWHGLFGGLYLSHLRQGIYKVLLESEAAWKSASHDGESLHIERLDYDADGRDEALVSGPVYNLYLQPHYGASAFEFDLLPLGSNLAGTLTRRPEPYHLKIKSAESQSSDKMESIHEMNWVKEKGLEGRIVHDWYQRRVFQDHIFSADTTVQRFARADCGEVGDFINQPYRLLESSSHPAGGAQLAFERQGGVYRNGSTQPLKILKTYYLKKDGGRVEYELEAGPAKGSPLHARFGVELNLTLPDAISPGQHLLVNRTEKSGLADLKEFKDVSSIALVDTGRKFSLSFKAEGRFNAWTFPVETVSQSECGMERTYQGTSILLWWPLDLASGQKQKITLEFKCSLA